jgi:signal transduction histidine kinase
MRRLAGRRPRRRDRSHAVRVAVVATVVVVALYVAGAFVLNAIVVARLTHEVDARLADRLAKVTLASLHSPMSTSVNPNGQSGGDIDDAPSFLWLVSPGGAVRSLTAGAPTLPRRRWTTTPVTITVGTTPFRFASRTFAGQVVVAGQSAAEIPRVRSAFIGPEIGFGGVLLVAVFLGALVIGLRASAPLEALRRRQADFTADASHELRTPLSVIEAEVDLALRREADSTDHHAVLQRIAAEGRRLRRVVDDLLWLARSDGVVPEGRGATACDLDAVAAGCAERFRAVSEARGVTLEVSTSGRRPYAVAAGAQDIDRLTGVLVDNACRYAGKGGRVQVRIGAAGNRVTLDVEDSGPGIPEDDVPFIFDRFHRATEAPGGTGLGLAIADAVVRSTRGNWSVGRSPLGGAHLGVSWRRAGRRLIGATNGASPTEEPPSNLRNDEGAPTGTAGV